MFPCIVLLILAVQSMVPNPELIPFYYVVIFISHLPFVQKREISTRQLPVCDFETCIGAVLEGNILVMCHCLLLLFFVPVLLLWFWSLGFGPARHRISVSRANPVCEVLSMALVCVLLGRQGVRMDFMAALDA